VIRRAHANLLLPALASAGLLMTPAALAATGGTGVSGSSGSSTSNPLVHPANRTETASGDGITVHTVATGVLTWRKRFSGTAPARDAGRVIEIQRTASATSSRWVDATRATVKSGGGFSVVWRVNRAGRLRFRAVLLRSASAAAAAAASPAMKITVYRLSEATWYGPGFFGHRTACGQVLHRGTLGVANRTLKCGTRVSILYHGRSITVPVIDRGPYGTSAYWDLTQATAKALGMTETSRIGTLFPY
jgi:hypothetical protein